MNSSVITCGQPDDVLLSVEDAQAALTAGVQPIEARTDLHLEQARGCILAKPVGSKIDVPGFDNSAMDGYAIAVSDTKAPLQYKVTQRIPAGTVGSLLGKGEAARIFTGAPVPPGANAVVMQEEVKVDGDRIEIGRTIRQGENIRPRGNDIANGDVVLEAGQRLGPQHIALAASVGLQTVPVYRTLRVGVFFTGDELVQPGTPLQPGQIYNSNRYALTSLLESMGCRVTDLGQVPDALDDTCTALAQLSNECDLVMTTGGVSVGEEDYVKSAVERLGELMLWRVAMKPGKPLAFGRVGDTPFIGLPGNPVSAFVTFLLFARPAILKMQGATDLLPRTVPVMAGFDWVRGRPRREFVRGKVESTATGPVVQLFPRQGSDVLTSMTWADGLVEIPEGRTFVCGEWLNFIPFCEVLT